MEYIPDSLKDVQFGGMIELKPHIKSGDSARYKHLVKTLGGEGPYEVTRINGSRYGLFEISIEGVGDLPGFWTDSIFRKVVSHHLPERRHTFKELGFESPEEYYKRLKRWGQR